MRLCRRHRIDSSRGRQQINADTRHQEGGETIAGMEGYSMRGKFREFDIANYLNTEEDIAGFLNEIAKEGDAELFQVALGDVARAKGMAKIAQRKGLSREHLYRALSENGNPRISTVSKVLDAIGIEAVFRKKSQKRDSAGSVGGIQRVESESDY